MFRSLYKQRKGCNTLSSDGTQTTKKECEYFYMFLNTLEDSYFDTEVERKQFTEIKDLYKLEIEELERYYKCFIEYRKKYKNDNL